MAPYFTLTSANDSPRPHFGSGIGIIFIATYYVSQIFASKIRSFKKTDQEVNIHSPLRARFHSVVQNQSAK